MRLILNGFSRVERAQAVAFLSLKPSELDKSGETRLGSRVVTNISCPER